MGGSVPGFVAQQINRANWKLLLANGAEVGQTIAASQASFGGFVGAVLAWQALFYLRFRSASPT